MDILTIVGVIVALAAIFGGNILEGGHTDSLMQLTALVIVLGGTLGAVMIQTQLSVFLRALQIVKWILIPPRLDHFQIIEDIVSWSKIARKEGLLGLENISENLTDDLARKGLQLLVDGSEPESIRDIMETEIASREHADNQAANVFEGMGGYAPTIGIIGAVMGLIHVMNNLADPSKLGAGIAVAFVATIYGVGLANLFFLPIASKLKGLVHRQVQYNEMILEGVIGIAEGENPRNIELKLQSYAY